MLWLGSPLHEEQLKGHGIRKGESAAEESWSLRVAGFLLVGQPRELLRQFWYFLQAEKAS